MVFCLQDEPKQILLWVAELILVLFPVLTLGGLFVCHEVLTRNERAVRSTVPRWAGWGLPDNCAAERWHTLHNGCALPGFPSGWAIRLGQYHLCGYPFWSSLQKRNYHWGFHTCLIFMFLESPLWTLDFTAKSKGFSTLYTMTRRVQHWLSWGRWDRRKLSP